MNIGFNIIEQNLLMNIENIILLVINIGMIIFYAVDFKLGAVLQFFINALAFVAFYLMGWDFKIVSIIFLASFVIMCLSLYAVAKSKESPFG